MDDLDKPNTKPGYCPVCGMPATIWNVMRSTWECTYCNWEGRNPDQKSITKREEYL